MKEVVRVHVQLRSRLQRELKLALSDADFDTAWNALLLDIPKARIELLRALRTHYRVFLLSNTNRIHIDHLCGYLQREHGEPSLHGLFEKCYLSYEMGMRKPQLEIYRHVLEDSGLRAEETVFLDDSLPNIEAAKRAGMHTVHIVPGKEITALFEK